MIEPHHCQRMRRDRPAPESLAANHRTRRAPIWRARRHKQPAPAKPGPGLWPRDGSQLPQAPVVRARVDDEMLGASWKSCDLRPTWVDTALRVTAEHGQGSVRQALSVDENFKRLAGDQRSHGS